MPQKQKKAEKCSVRDDILLSLSYLRDNCALKECENVIKLSLDLCFSCIDFDHRSKRAGLQLHQAIQGHGVVGALEFLRNQAKNSQLDEVGLILEATLHLCLVTEYFRYRGEFASFDGMIGKPH